MTVMNNFFGEMTRSQISIRLFTFIHVKTLKRETGNIYKSKTNKIIMTNTSYFSYHLQGEQNPQDLSSSAWSSQAVGSWFEEVLQSSIEGVEMGDDSLYEGVEQDDESLTEVVEQGLSSLNQGVEQCFDSQNEGVEQGFDSWNEWAEQCFDSWIEAVEPVVDSLNQGIEEGFDSCIVEQGVDSYN